MPCSDFVLCCFPKGQVRSTADMFDDEEGDLFKEKAALPGDTVNQTDEKKARAQKQVKQREEA